MGLAYGRTTEQGDPNKSPIIILRIPFKTPTVNHLYGQRRTGFGQTRFIKKEAMELRAKIKHIVNESLPFVCANLNNGLKVTVSIHEDWLTKKGEVKTKDIANREKFLIDSVFNALNIDDKFIFEHHIYKIQDNEEFSIIEVEEIS